MYDEHKQFQTILCRDNSREIYNLNTITYGTASAPYLVTRCLKKIAIENADTCLHIANVINKDFL